MMFGASTSNPGVGRLEIFDDDSRSELPTFPADGTATSVSQIATNTDIADTNLHRPKVITVIDEGGKQRQKTTTSYPSATRSVITSAPPAITVLKLPSRSSANNTTVMTPSNKTTPRLIKPKLTSLPARGPTYIRPGQQILRAGEYDEQRRNSLPLLVPLTIHRSSAETIHSTASDVGSKSTLQFDRPLSPPPMLSSEVMAFEEPSAVPPPLTKMPAIICRSPTKENDVVDLTTMPSSATTSPEKELRRGTVTLITLTRNATGATTVPTVARKITHREQLAEARRTLLKLPPDPANARKRPVAPTPPKARSQQKARKSIGNKRIKSSAPPPKQLTEAVSDSVLGFGCRFSIEPAAVDGDALEATDLSPCWRQLLNSKVDPLIAKKATNFTADTVQNWTAGQVSKFVLNLPYLGPKFAVSFREQLIDGEALLLLTLDDLIQQMGVKVGPAIKLYNTLLHLKHGNVHVEKQN